jgi:hypothetical protein
LIYRSADYCRELGQKVFAQVEADFKLYSENDLKILRKDTASGLVSILDSLKDFL